MRCILQLIVLVRNTNEAIQQLIPYAGLLRRHCVPSRNDEVRIYSTTWSRYA